MVHTAKVVEHEVKLGAHPTFVIPDLDFALAGTASTLDLGERTLTATYWDTSDLRLTRSGLSLRHRSAKDGSERGWTVKVPTGDGGSEALVRCEVTFAGPATTPPRDASALIIATTRGRQIEPVARLVTRRRRRHVLDAEGRPALEICDDLVSVMNGRRVAARFREIEVELVVGNHDGARLLPLVVAVLVDAGAGSPDPTPKIVRALGPTALAPPDIEVTVVGPKASAGDVVQAAIGHGAARLVAHDPGVRLGGDDEDVHQARVATRRLRSDLATFRSALDEGWVAQIRAELGWLAGELGGARDADVLATRLVRQISALGQADADGAAVLLCIIDAERTEARGRAAAALETARYSALLDQLVAASRMPPLTETAGARAAVAVPRMVAKAWGHLVTAVERTDDDPAIALLHEVRKKAKRCRYACEAASSVCGKEAKTLGAAAAAIQEVLGELQDAVVAESWLRSRVAGLTGSGAVATAFSAGLLTGIQKQAADEACREWRAAWNNASAKKLRKWLP